MYKDEALKALNKAVAAFKKTPSATNYRVLQVRMLTYQEACTMDI